MKNNSFLVTLNGIASHCIISLYLRNEKLFKLSRQSTVLFSFLFQTIPQSTTSRKTFSSSTPFPDFTQHLRTTTKNSLKAHDTSPSMVSTVSCCLCRPFFRRKKHISLTVAQPLSMRIWSLGRRSIPLGLAVIKTTVSSVILILKLPWSQWICFWNLLKKNALYCVSVSKDMNAHIHTRSSIRWDLPF